jgi:deoxyribonuclease V
MQREAPKDVARGQWSPTVAEARDAQLRLRERLRLELPPGFSPRTVAGADLSISRGSRRGFAGLVVLELETGRVVDEAWAEAELTFPYVPGLLSFRELPPLEMAWAKLRSAPDAVIFDAHGLAHPRRFGLACHGGVVFATPSIGCAKSLLVGTHGDLGWDRGSTADLVDRGEVVGAAVRTRTGVKPVYVSVGHRMELQAAIGLVLRLSGYREPETTRRAHRLVNQVRRDGGA